MMRTTILCALALIAAPLQAREPLQQRVEAILAEAGPGVRYGLVVTDAAGKEIVAVRPDDRFIPASNTKIVTTATAYATMTGLNQPDMAGGATIRIVDGDVILTGHGDARMSSAPDCTSSIVSRCAPSVSLG